MGKTTGIKTKKICYVNFFLQMKYAFVYMKVIVNDGVIPRREYVLGTLNKSFYDKLLHAQSIVIVLHVTYIKEELL